MNYILRTVLLQLVALCLVVFTMGVLIGRIVATATLPEPAPEPEPGVLLVEHGRECWLDANPEFRYIANSPNVQVYVTCEYEVMEVYVPAAGFKSALTVTGDEG